MNGNNPYYPYWVSNTLNFTYNGKNVWATILKFGKDWITCITKDGYRSYKWSKMTPPTLYQCRVSDVIPAPSVGFKAIPLFSKLWNYS